MNPPTTAALLVVQSRFSTHATMRDRIKRWIIPPYIRQLVSGGTVVVLIGRAGVGKTVLLNKAKLPRVHHGVTALPDGLFGLDEPAGHAQAAAIKTRLRSGGAGFALALQDVTDLQVLDLLPELAQRPVVEFFVIEDGSGRVAYDTYRWIAAHWRASPPVSGRLVA